MFILYEGPSKYDNAPIVVIATTNTTNPKTGPMWQTWIMRQDVAPHEAVKTGDDASVCGACPLRPLSYKAAGLKKKCYVKTWQAPLGIWKKYKRNGYEHIEPEQFGKLLKGQALRLGSYGDPAAMPYEIWQAIGVGSGKFKHTGYTHGWLLPNFDTRMLEICMESLDEASEQAEQIPEGRSYRVIEPEAWKALGLGALRLGEILCPASDEAGKKSNCFSCGLCAGTSRQAKNIAIVSH